MSVITTWEATPNRVFHVWKLLQLPGVGPSNGEDLSYLIGPPSIRGENNSDSSYRHLIEEVHSLGIIKRDGQEYAVIPELEGNNDETLANYLQRILLNIDESQRCSQEGFTKSLLWLLHQDPLTGIDWGINYRNLVLSDCGPASDGFELNNNQGCQQFVYWARYLGFARRINTGRNANKVVPDPTQAIRNQLSMQMETGVQYRIDDIWPELVYNLPVLEGGLSYEVVNEMFDTDKQYEKPTNLSPATSLAFKRLQESKLIDLTRLSDAEPWLFRISPNSDFDNYSHITWIGDKR